MKRKKGEKVKKYHSASPCWKERSLSITEYFQEERSMDSLPPPRTNGRFKTNQISYGIQGIIDH